MTGWDVARGVRERWPEMPVGLVTGWGEQDLTPEERGRVNFVLTKPFDRQLLREALAPIRKSSRQTANVARRIVQRYQSSTWRRRASATARRSTLPSGSLRAT